ncbi:hypothetical protein AURDEDRAFT_168916 [Auricularia subglabra TFB-10046 SS5]|nr:hypothetical protein AURDEDRAFT_168916 [Auricularia subglabra TFB-10046 SS5]
MPAQATAEATRPALAKRDTDEEFSLEKNRAAKLHASTPMAGPGRPAPRTMPRQTGKVQLEQHRKGLSSNASVGNGSSDEQETLFVVRRAPRGHTMGCHVCTCSAGRDGWDGFLDSEWTEDQLLHPECKFRLHRALCRLIYT